jgi:hypothetical protein
MENGIAIANSLIQKKTAMTTSITMEKMRRIDLLI